LVIDDGSTDQTARIAQEAGAIVLESRRNLGKGASLLRGFDFCLKRNYAAVITMDGDGQHRTQDIKVFLEAADKEDAQIFVGNRMHRPKGMPILRWLTNIFMSWVISWVIRQKVADSQCGFRLIRREVLENIKLESKKYEIESEILIRAGRQGFKISSVPIESIYRGEKSQINPFIDTLRFIRFIIRELWIMQS